MKLILIGVLAVAVVVGIVFAYQQMFQSLEQSRIQAALAQRTIVRGMTTAQVESIWNAPEAVETTTYLGEFRGILFPRETVQAVVWLYDNGKRTVTFEHGVVIAVTQ